MPNPPSDGGAQAIHNTTRGFLENNVKVKVLAINSVRNFIDINELPEDYVKATMFESVKVDTRIKPFKIFANFFGKDSYFIERFRSKAFEKKLTEVLLKNQYDIIQLEHLYLFLYFDLIRAKSNAKIVFRPQNVEFVIWERYLRKISNPLKKMFIKVATKRLKKFEKSNARKADGIITLTRDDTEIFKKFAQEVPIIDIPMGFDFGNLTDYNYVEQYNDFPIFYHLASMDWLPNEEAMKWFVDEIADLVIKEIPDIRIHIAGRNMQNYFYRNASKNLIIEGEIKNPIEYQKDKAIMIVPLLSGSGIRAKIVEGIALGKTIITTIIGAQGIKYEDGKNILIADTPDEFVKQISKCYYSKDLCKMIGNNARELAKTSYHYVSNARDIQDFYQKILLKSEI